LQGLEQRHPYNLSGGEKRRLSVATMLVLKPDLLVLDEPSYAQDEENLRNLVSLIFELARDTHTSLVFITHDLDLAARYASRVVVMKAGRLLFDGMAAELFARDEVREHGGLLTTPVMQLVSALRAQGWSLPSHVVTAADFVRLWPGRADHARGGQ
jgi:energy-coupling factor transport system ATP-binding protein